MRLFEIFTHSAHRRSKCKWHSGTQSGGHLECMLLLDGGREQCVVGIRVLFLIWQLRLVLCENRDNRSEFTQPEDFIEDINPFASLLFTYFLEVLFVTEHPAIWGNVWREEWDRNKHISLKTFSAISPPPKDCKQLNLFASIIHGAGGWNLI